MRNHGFSGHNQLLHQRMAYQHQPGLGPKRAQVDEQTLPVPRPERSRVIWGAKTPAIKGLRPRYGEKVVSALGRCVDPATIDMVTFPGIGSAPHRAAPAAVAAQLCEFLLGS